MNQNTCKTCKWWKWNNDLGFTTGSGEFIPWGTPRIRFVCGGTGQWKAADGMVDAEDYGGVLTGPDFGCIHYEEIQEQLPQDHPGYAAQQVKLAAAHYGTKLDISNGVATLTNLEGSHCVSIPASCAPFFTMPKT